MASFKLLWENNPDTPIDSNRLSSSIDYYSKQSILYFDSNELESGEDILKLRSNVKVNIEIPTTLSAWDFNNSLVSYNSKFAPEDAENIIFRDEYNNSPGSVAIDAAIDNVLTNSGFESGLTDWTFTDDNGSIVSVSTSEYYPSNLSTQSAEITVNSSGTLCELSRQSDTSTVVGNYSLSFYYKTSTDLYLQIKTFKNGNDNYWNGNNWVFSQAYFTMPYTDNQWHRYEMQEIDVSLINYVEIILYSDYPNSTHYVDSFLLELKDYCSSYYPTSIGDSLLTYSRDVIILREGLIDFTFYPKIKEDVTLFLVKSVSGNDLLKLVFDESENKFVFTIYDKNTSQELTYDIIFNFDNIIDEWTRVIISWSETLKKVYVNIGTYLREFDLPTGYFAEDQSNISKVYIGSDSDGTHLAKSLFEFLKFDIEYKNLDEINNLLLYPSEINDSDFKVFENENKSLIINHHLLDTGTNFANNRTYYIWVADNNDGDSCELLVSLSDHNPSGYIWYRSRIIGGFRTDSSRNIIKNSVWDISTKLTTNLHIDRLLIGGTRTLTIDDVGAGEDPTPVEISTTPYGDVNNAIYNIDSYFTRHVYGRNITDGNFLDIDNENGSITIDDIHIDGHIMNSNDTDFELYASGSNTLSLHSDEIIITSEGTDVKIDDIRILNNTIYVANGNDLIINSNIDDATSDNNIQVIANDVIVEPKNDFVVDADNQIQLTAENSILITSNTNNIVTSSNNFTVSTDNIITLDDIKIDANKIYRDGTLEVINIESTGNININSLDENVTIEEIDFNDNKIFQTNDVHRYISFYDDGSPVGFSDSAENIDIAAGNKVVIDSPVFHVKSQEVWFEADLSDFIRLDYIKINGSQLYTETGYPLSILSPENITINSGSTLSLQGPPVQIENITLTDKTLEPLDGAWTLGNIIHQTNIKGNGFDVYSETGYVDFSSDIRVSSGSGSILANASSATEFETAVDLDFASTDTTQMDTYNQVYTLTGTEGTIDVDVTHTHDGRYYTETEADNRFVNMNGDTMTDDLNFTITASATSKGITWTGLTDEHKIYVEETAGGEETSLIIESGNNAGTDKTIFRNRDGVAPIDVLTLNNNLVHSHKDVQIGDSGTLEYNQSNPVGTEILGYNGYFYANRVYNAVWQDLAECWEKNPQYTFGYNIVVVQTEHGVRPSMKRAEKTTVGVISDTYGYILNADKLFEHDLNKSESVPVAIAGRAIVAYVGDIAIGDEVVSYKNGNSIKANIFEKICKRDRILGKVDKILSSNLIKIKVYG